MPQNLENTLAVLERTPKALDALLRGLPDVWTQTNEGESTFTAQEVIAHLVHGERADWLVRARMILESGETETFARVERRAHLKESAGKALGQLLDEFAKLRAANLKELRSWKLGTAELEKRGRHPGFGPVTMSELLATWAVHDMTHLHQISRILASQYRELVGPFRVYLGVLQCEGHSAAAVELRQSV